MVLPLEDNIALGIIGINIVLTLILVVLYAKNYRAISSRLTLGLVVFMLAFLIENIIDLYFYNTVLSQQIFGLTSFGLGVNLLEMVGLIVLAWVTWK